MCGGKKFNREELGGFGRGRLKTVWFNHTMNKLIPWIEFQALRM